jgi:hypothetical protein
MVMAKKSSYYATIALLVLAGLAAEGYWVIERRSESICGVCQRPIRPELGVVAEIGGRRRHVCCARCAITEAHQENKPLRLIEVTDYPTRKKIDPNQAWFVEDSRLMACDHDMAHMDADKHMQQLAFDRCAPGAFAFARRADADAFVAQNGGVVRRLAEMTGEVQSQ